MTAILIHSPAIALPAYVAHFLRSRREALLKKNQGSTISGITRESLALEQIPLPPLSEQQRIVEILQEAEEIRRLRAEVEAKTAQLIPAFFNSLFSPLFGASVQRKNIRLSDIADVQGGVQVIKRHDNMPLKVPYLRVANVQRGVISLDEIKEIGITEDEFTRTKLKKGDILIVEGHGNPMELRRAAIWNGELDICTHQNHLIRVRCAAGIDPSYVMSLINGPLARRYFLTAGNTTSGLNTISTNVVREFRFPLPDSKSVQRFSDACNQVAALIDSETGSPMLLAKLTASLLAHAFSGQLTTEWREAHRDMLALEAGERDAALKEAGASLSRFRRDTIQEMEAVFQDRTEGIYSDLNREQRILLREIDRMVGGVSYARYFTANKLSNYLTDNPLRRNPQAIEEHLAVFAARGLLIPVSKEEQTEDTGEFVFGRAYRLPLRDREPHEGEQGEPRIGDRSRGRELERLAAQLEKEQTLT